MKKKKQPYGAFRGAVKIGQRSSLRKLMRADRRGKMPDERQVVIDAAIEKAASRKSAYLNSHARQMVALRSVLS